MGELVPIDQAPLPPPDDDYVAAGFLAGYGQPTRGLYTTNLKQWFAWCRERGIRPLTAERAHIEVWARELEEREGLKPSTVANKLTTLVAFYRSAKRDRYIVDNPGEYLRKPKVPRISSRQALTRAELLHVLDVAQKHGSDQDHALLCLLAFNGLRIGEALALDVEDLGRQGGYRTLHVRREKGNREGLIPLAPRTSWAFDTMLGTRTTGPLFRMGKGQRMDRQGANRVIQRILKKAGIVEKRITPHSFRHTMITLSLNAGVSVRDITNSMGYSDSRQVSYYDRAKDDLTRNATWMMSAFVEGS